MRNIHSSQESLLLWIHRLLDLTIPVIVIIQLASIKSLKANDHYIIAGLLAGLAITTFAQMNGTYSDWRGRSIFASFRKVILSWILSWLLVVSLAFVMKISESFSREVWLLWLGITPMILTGYRIMIRKLLSLFRKQGIGQRNVLILGGGDLGIQLASIFDNNAWMGFKVVGFLDDDAQKKGKTIGQHTIFDDINKTLRYADQYNISEVFICLPKKAEYRTKEIFDMLADSSLIVKYVPDLFSFNLMHSNIEIYQGIPVIGVYNTPLSSRTNRLIKRLEDISLSVMILLLISPIMLLIAAGVKLSSPGPIFYRQTRITEGNKPFQMFKFRSMPVDADKGGAVWGNANKKTKSKFGKFIRKTSLDELPQFINVLKGEMSIVGPRPERDVFVEEFKNKIPRYMQKHMVKAGITGLAQISGLRGDTCLNTRIEYDLRYISAWSLSLDIKIIFKTIGKAFKDPVAQ
jgi:putative colanic acid biosynthesis UDP-glucose lipid carrier transferase